MLVTDSNLSSTNNFSKVKEEWATVNVTEFGPYYLALQARLIDSIWNDAAIKQEILTNPKAVFERECNLTLPANVEVKVLEEDDDIFHIVIPAMPETQERWQVFYDQMSIWWTLTYTFWWRMYSLHGASSQQFREVLETLIIVRFMQDKSLRESLFNNPKPTLEKQAGVTIPANMTIQPLQETPNLLYFVLPKNPQTDKLPTIKQPEDVSYWWMSVHTWFWWLASLWIQHENLKAQNNN
jgi:hypothetical protein